MKIDWLIRQIGKKHLTGNEASLVDAVVVDIDDTLIETLDRRHAAWCQVLERDIPKHEVEALSSREILRRYAFSDETIRKQFWMLILCVEKDGVDLLELDRSIPYASEVLQNWSKNYGIVYLTGRTQNMRQPTMNQLRKFGFPTRGTELVMFTLKDWMQFFSSASSVIETRARLFSSILKRHNVIRVVDDYPDFFAAYRRYAVPDRVGVLRENRFSLQEYLDKGATRVVHSQKQLLE